MGVLEGEVVVKPDAKGSIQSDLSNPDDAATESSVDANKTAVPVRSLLVRSLRLFQFFFTFDVRSPHFQGWLKLCADMCICHFLFSMFAFAIDC